MIRHISIKRQAELAVYERLKRAWRKSEKNQVCCVPGCGKAADRNPHHSHGRSGKMLNQVKYWKPVCFTCHRKIHDNINWARKMGLIAEKGKWLNP
jgi:hypothetical protein